MFSNAFHIPPYLVWHKATVILEATLAFREIPSCQRLIPFTVHRRNILKHLSFFLPCFSLAILLSKYTRKYRQGPLRNCMLKDRLSPWPFLSMESDWG